MAVKAAAHRSDLRPGLAPLVVVVVVVMNFI